MTSPSPLSEIKTNRIEALSDGVFAIAMTLLILDIKVPDLHGAAIQELPQHLFELWPKLLSYAVSFVTLGVYWIGHHMQLHYIGRADRPLLWITIVFLLTVGLVPFATALLGEYPAQQLAIVVYGGNLALIGVVLELHWWYATGAAGLVKTDTPPAVRRMAARRTRIGPIVYALGIGTSFFSTPLALALYALVPLLYLIPGSIDAHWRAR